jgi:Flp pilus assembly protein TadG
MRMSRAKMSKAHVVASLSRWMSRFKRNKNGATAVEFAMISPMFFGLLLAIMESGMMFLTSTAVSEGVKEASRVVMTGQVASAGSASAQLSAFKAAFCAQTDWLLNCDNVKYDVRSFKVFGANMMESPLTNGALDPSKLKFDPGQPCYIVVVRAYYEMTAYTGMIRHDVSNMGGGNVLISGSMAFKNEPFGTC